MKIYSIGLLLIIFLVCFLVILEYTKLTGISLILFTVWWFTLQMYIFWII
jgi:hypothetical protein